MPHLEDPPKSPLKRGTLNPQDFPPFLRGARGDLICSIIKGNWYYLGLGLAALTCPLLLTSTTLANEFPPPGTAIEQETITPEQPIPTWEELSQDSQENSAMEQVTSVSQLSDVRPNDWAYQALQSLVERYGCIAGYPDGTYRGDRTLTRYEFAVGLNACINRITIRIANSTATDLVNREDLAKLQRLQEEFSEELIALKGQLNNLEARTTTLETRQFSTTTEFEGEVIIAVVGAAGGEKADGSGESVDDNLTLSNRVRLAFETSFTGEDEKTLTKALVFSHAGF